MSGVKVNTYQNEDTVAPMPCLLMAFIGDTTQNPSLLVQ